MIKQITIIGVGLIGGSLARSLKALQPAIKIVGYDIDTHATQFALENNWLDQAIENIDKKISHSDIIFITTPPKIVGEVLSAIKPFLNKKIIVSDCTSVKATIVTQAKEILGDLFAQFVPAHPIAGSEKNGIQHAREDLFKNRPCILTPATETNRDALNTISELWQRLGAKIITMSAPEHDEIVAYTSHLPHLLAFAFLNSMQTNKIDLIAQCTGKGFEDFSRIGGADPTLWSDILSENSEQLLKKIDSFSEQLQQLKQSITDGQSSRLTQTLQKAAELKKKLSKQ